MLMGCRDHGTSRGVAQLIAMQLAGECGFHRNGLIGSRLKREHIH
jgi:hypothetical protein